MRVRKCPRRRRTIQVVWVVVKTEVVLCREVMEQGLLDRGQGVDVVRDADWAAGGWEVTGPEQARVVHACALHAAPSRHIV